MGAAEWVTVLVAAIAILPGVMRGFGCGVRRGGKTSPGNRKIQRRVMPNASRSLLLIFAHAIVTDAQKFRESSKNSARI